MSIETDLVELRKRAKEVAGAAKVERRVYELPKQLVIKIVQYQIDNELRSETEVVRQLLNEALS